MRQAIVKRAHLLVLLLPGLLLPVPWLRAQDVAVSTSSPALSADQLWLASSDSVLRGDFQQARGLMDTLLGTDPANEQFQEVSGWLAQWGTADRTRQDLEIQQRDRHLEMARRHIEKEKWDNALSYVHAALKSAPEAAEFMREPWVQELLDKSVASAQQHEGKGEWADASSLYYKLHNLFEGNVEYKKNMERCVAHSRLDVLYDEEAEWEQRLSGITRQMAEEALRRVSVQYVVEANFRGLTRAAYERMLILPESAGLRKLFPTLQDEEQRLSYLRRIERQLERLDHNYAEGPFTYEDARRYFSAALRINEQTIQIREELVIYEYLDSGLESLDQFTSMIWPTDYAEFEKHTQGHFIGVGIQIGLQNEILTVISPLDDTPAFRAGIQADDQVTHIDGENAKGLTLTEAVRKITGPIKTKVVLRIHRPSTDETFDVPLVRDEVHIKTVKGHKRLDHSDLWDYMIDPDLKIAYVRVSNFNEGTAEDLEKALLEVDHQGGRALILDLRFNPGGLLRSSVQVSDLFLDAKLDVVSTSGLSSPHEQAHKSVDDAMFSKPLIVLVNEQSASASEIVSGALKDHQRAVILGERTFGKGSVQNLIPIGSSQAHIKLTTAHYYLPSGKLIHRMPDAESWGVEPDVQVVLTPSETGKVYTMRRDADVIRRVEGAAEKPVTGEGTSTTPGGGTAADPGAQKVEPLPAPTDAPSIDGPPARGPGDPVNPVLEALESGLPGETQGTEGPAAPEDGASPEGDAAAEEEDEVPSLPPIELPDVDYQLDAALLMLRVQLLQDHGFGILPKVKLGAKSERDKNVATN